MVNCWCADNPRISRGCICVDDTASESMRAVLAVFPTEDQARAWLRRFNPRLGSVPNVLIRNGHGRRVVVEARRAVAA